MKVEAITTWALIDRATSPAVLLNPITQVRLAGAGSGALTNGDVPPFTMVGTDSLGRPRGINSEGLKRRGFDADRISAIKRAYRTLYVAGLPLAEAKQQLTEQARDSNDVKAMLDFIEHAERPLLR